MPLLQQLGAWALVVRPLYLVTEVAVALAAAGTSYSLVRDTVSDLGRATSGGHALVNGSFVAYGVLLALGALLLLPRLGAVAGALLVVAGLGSVGVGLAPVDSAPTWHVVAAVPVFVAQPVALGLLARRFGSRALGVAAVVVALGAVAFVLPPLAPVAGLVERVALWPVFPALAAVGLTVVAQAQDEQPAPEQAAEPSPGDQEPRAQA